jgi:hypothetical protein
MCIGYAIVQLQAIWTFKSSLIPVRGTIESADIDIKTVTDRKGHKSQVSEVVFYLNESKMKFQLAENIGSGCAYDDHFEIVKGLKKSKSVTVWIKERDLNETGPEIFEIENENGYVLLDIETVKADKRPITAFLLFMGMGSIVFFFWIKYPDKFRKVFS